ncbi:helix-turn-helix domain-containing protein [Streptomyces sp. NPDC004680]|uniref:helix-turn-helix domain-containing protein n=1 Tax=Streptomyces sp. NPDC004680 TaxID=3154287 RepID=UPI0033B33372
MWEAVGLSGDDALVYEALVRRGQSEAESLSAGTGLARGRASRILGRLVERGLATRLPVRPVQYVAVPPDVAANELIAERQRELMRLRAHAQQLATEQAEPEPDAPDPASLIEIVEGAVNVQNAVIRLQRTAQREIRTFDMPPYLDHPVDGNPEQFNQAEQRGLVYRVVYHPSAFEPAGRLDDVWRRVQHGERARVSARVPMKLMLCDDRFALIPISRRGAADAAYLVRESCMLDAFAELFEVLWDRAVAFNRLSQDVEEPERPVVSNELLGLLATGATDETIARMLGWSVRTVHRHMHKMMAQTGAETRFQAGMEVVRRGWA